MMRAFLKGILRYKYMIIMLLVAGALGYTGYAWYLESSKPVSSFRTFMAERADMEAQVSATGTISPVNSVDVSSKISGLIEKVNIEENQEVKEGDILVVLDDTSIKTQVDQAKAKLVNAQLNYERKIRLANIGAIAVNEFDTAQMEYEVAKATYDSALSSLADTVIRAPLSGVVIGKPIPAGQTVSPGISTPMVLLTIADMSLMQIETKVDESDIGKIALGQKALFTVDSYPGKNFTGAVSLISRQATVEQNVVYYRVMINIDSPEGLLLPTMTARVSIVVGTSKNTLQVPLMAVKENKGVKYVQVLRNNGEQPENVNVVTGLSTDERVEILEGLKEGDRVVLPQSKQTVTAGPGGMMGMMGGGRR